MVIFYSDKKQKLSKAVMRNCQDVPYSSFCKILRNKDIKVNGQRVKEDVYINENDSVEIFYTPVKRDKFSEIFKDDNILVINKKSGYSSESVYEEVVDKYKDAKFIHRLDRNTSGIMIFALNIVAEKELLNGFKERSFEKYYIATVKGILNPKEAVLTAYLLKDEKDGVVRIFSEDIKGSVKIKTGYKVLTEGENFSVLRIRLYTGKTHQIRAHLSFIGHPIVGDGKYGDNAFNKQMGAKTQKLCATELVLHFDGNSPLSYLDGKRFLIDG